MTTDSGAEADMRFANWLRTQLDNTGMKTTEVIARGTEAGQFSKVTFYRWLNGEHAPGSKSVEFLAGVFGADPREGYDAAGLGHLMDVEGDIVIADPAALFIARIKARGFAPHIEARLIDYVRNEVEQRKRALDEMLDTVEANRDARGTDAS